MKKMIMEYQALLSMYRNEGTFNRCKWCSTRLYILKKKKKNPTKFVAKIEKVI